jgi:ABC-type bacteriocin/lantibiotic exporter with double-glycine peptidase domain
MRPELVVAKDARSAATGDLLGQLAASIWSGPQPIGALQACFCALVTALDRGLGARAVIEALPSPAGTFDLLDLFNAMANLGFQPRTAAATLATVDERLLPCLFRPQAEGAAAAPLVLLRITADRDGERELWAYDGATRRVRRIDLGGEDAGRPGQIDLFLPYDAQQDPTSKFARAGTGHRWFRALLSRFRGLLGQIFLVGTALNAVALATPLFIMLVYDRVIASRSPETLAGLTVGVGLAIATEWALRAVRSKSLAWLAARLDHLVNTAVFERLFGLPAAALERASVPAQIARIKTFESVRDLFSGSVFLSFLEIPFTAVALLAIAWMAGPLAMVPLIALAVYLAVFWVLRHRIKLALRVAAKASSARQRFAIETFEKIEAIRANGLSDRWAAMYRTLSGRECTAGFRLAFIGMVGETLGHAISLIAAAATIGLGVDLIRQEAISTGGLIASMILVWRVLGPFHSLCSMIPRLEQLRNSIIQVNSLMDFDDEAATSAAASRLGVIKGRLAFERVGFRYALDHDPVLIELTFEAAPGELVVITGSNGAGKTTLLKLARGLHRPQAGAVRLDGFDLRQLDAMELRRRIGYVPQRPVLFAGTIADNLRLGAPAAPDRALWQALESVGAAAAVAALPDQLATRLRPGDAERQLSANLAARLNLARALLQEAPLLAIDEIPNALLAGAEGEAFKGFLRRQHGRRTILLAGHRPDLLRLADQVICLRAGAAVVGPAATALDLAYAS